jgi:hypothetical protein
MPDKEARTIQIRDLQARVDELTAELARWQEVAASENKLLDAWIATAGKHQREAEQFKRERDAARRDSARLDFIEGSWQLRIGTGAVWDAMHDVHQGRTTLRDAIDAALQERE